MAARRFAISRRLRPASTRSLVRSLATKVAFPALLLANMQIFTMVFSAWPDSKCLLCNVITESLRYGYIFRKNVWEGGGGRELPPTAYNKEIHMKARVY